MYRNFIELRILIRSIAIFAMTIFLSNPLPISADGGIVFTDPTLWAMIEEGQQIAVIRLNQDDTAQVDLFISMLDRSGDSHEVTFFIPLGEKASQFKVIEETSLDFDEALTEQLDSFLLQQARREASYKDNVRIELLLGTFMTNGIWSWALFFLLPAGGCGVNAPAPVATFQTKSSHISIYEMDERMDIQSLIDTTGLDDSVRETLEDLEGQQIAVIRLKTQPVRGEEAQASPYATQGQPGLHLSWETTLVPHSERGTVEECCWYDYPLGTGRAWASPIELTRVYIVAPPGVDFDVQAPRLGMELSGMGGVSGISLPQSFYWKIDRTESPAFATHNAYGDFGRIWRGTYVKSNSDQDIRITKMTRLTQETLTALRANRFRVVVLNLTWFLSLLAAAFIWLASWCLVMRRWLRVPYHWRDGKLYVDAFTWSLAYPATILASIMVFGVLGFLFSWISMISETTALIVVLPAVALILIVVLGLVNAFFFSRLKASKYGASRWQAFGAYMLVVLVANLIYLGFATGYAAVVGAI